MAISHFERLLLDATVPDETQRPLDPDYLYGLYTSWCLLHHITPVEDITFRSAMARRRIDLTQDGGADRNDYILASCPESV
jgi:hypothetical protein